MRSTTARLAAVDEANLVLDHAGQVNVFLFAGFLAPGGFVGRTGVPDLAILRATISERIADLGALHRIPQPSRRGHQWVQAMPDLTQHVRQCPPAAGVTGLEQLCGRLMTEPLPLDRPLWELLIVPDSTAPRVGIIFRIHHATADGITAVAIAHGILDIEPKTGGGRSSPPSPTTSAAASRHRRLLHRVERTLFGLRRVATTLMGHGVGQTLLLGARGPRRGVVFVDVGLTALTERLAPVGATVNDALLSATAAGYAAILVAAGEDLPTELPVSVPVALERRRASANQVGVMLVRLPMNDPDPESRLRRIVAQTRTEKPRAREQGTLEFMRGPLGARIMDRIGRRQRVVAGFVTNVPGPPTQLFLAGAPVEASWPVAVLAANVRLGVAAASYNGRLWCGIHFDADTVPGSAFATAMNREFGRLTTNGQAPSSSNPL